MAAVTHEEVSDPSACMKCGEVAVLAEPCACVRGAPAPLSEQPAHACADSQHYACHGYLLESAPGAEIWLRCNCSCHVGGAAAKAVA